MHPIWILAFVVVHVLGFTSSIHALMSVRTPQGSIAWVVSLNAFPWIAVPAYWVFGRSKFHGYVVARKAEDAELDEDQQRIAADLRRYTVPVPDERGGILAAERLAKLPFTGSNSVELLIDGEATFESILAGMREAREYILFQFYIVRSDGIGRRLAECLRERAAAGVRVYFLYDEFGSHGLAPDYVSELEASGVQLRPFQSTRGGGNRFQLNFRNHRKIVVVDGHVGWVGGTNVGDEYLGLDPKIGDWRDTHTRIAGPAVMGLQVSFAEDWHWATDEVLELNWTPVPAASPEAGSGPAADVQVLILPTGPADESEAASLMFQHAIHSARDRIWIASPYFVPDEGVMGALKIARLRGVDVKVLIPDQPDHLLVYLSAFAFVGGMLDSGIEIHRYQAGFLHQKVFLVDDRAAGVGTANLDNRSFRLNFEVTALVADADFAAEVERMLVADFDRAQPMTRAQLDARPFWFRAAARAAYLTAPIQ